jgi:DNA-binding transcriptional MerR regulator
MNQNEIQKILSILDTVHDYGNTGRVNDVFKKKKMNTEFNPAFIIDFLILGYVHHYFKDIIGLSKSQHYLKDINNCNRTDYLKSNTKIINLFCKNFYFPTYGDRIIYRSPSPETVSKSILFEYLKEKNIQYKEKVCEWNDLKKSNLIKLNLGNKKDGTGIYALEDIEEQASKLYTKLQYFYNAKELSYVTDANKMNNKWFCVSGQSYTHYKGIFSQFDSFKTKTQSGGMGKFDLDEYRCNEEEFQTYTLTEKGGELLKLTELYVNKEDDLYTLEYKLDKSQKLIKLTEDDSSKKDPRGLSLFLLLFNEINKKTLGYLSFNKGDAKKHNLEEDIKNIGYNALKDKYKIGLDLIDSDKSIVLLKPKDFVLVLLDLKRSMDYLYVKAAYSANQNQNDKKYIFISSDRSAVYYSLLLNTPAILTPPKDDLGNRYIYLYNPTYKKSNANVNTNVKNNVKNNANVNVPKKEESLIDAQPINVAKNFIQSIKIDDTYEILNKIKSLKTYINTDISSEDCKTFLEEYDDQSTDKVTNPITKRQNAKTNVLIKKLYEKCSKEIKNNVQKQQEKDEAEAFQKEQEKEEIDEMNKNIMSIIREGIKIKTNDSSKHFGESQIKTRLDKYNIKYPDFCDFLFKNSNNVIVKEFKKNVFKTSAQKVCPGIISGIKSGGNSDDYMDKALSIKIPLTNLDQICEVESPMYIFFQFYSQINQNIDFFWFIVFKSLLYFTFGDDMDKKDCQVFMNMSQNELRFVSNSPNINSTSVTTNNMRNPSKQNTLAKNNINNLSLLTRSISANLNSNPNKNSNPNL